MITKAIIPVAGIGSRFLPASKSIPKEMFPVVAKPVIQYIVEDAVASGIKDIIFVTSRAKKSLEDYFDCDFELESRLNQKGKAQIAKEVHRLSELANFYFLRQPEPRGDGDAVLRARHLIKKDEAVLIMWGDDVIITPKPSVSQLIKVYQKYRAPVIALEEIRGPAIERYGVIDGKEVEHNVYKISHIIEKPKYKSAPSCLTIVGRYIISWEVIEALLKQKPSADGEIRFSHGLRDVLQCMPVYGHKFKGLRFDCGSKLGWLQANIAVGLKDKEIKKELKNWMNKTLLNC
jgi:UTP--glucose-1-phosphate uridylyltransferase